MDLVLVAIIVVKFTQPNFHLNLHIYKSTICLAQGQLPAHYQCLLGVKQ